MMFATIIRNPVFKKAWLSVVVIFGVLSILSGSLLAVRGRPESIAGVVGGAILLGIALVGFLTLARRSVPHA